MVRGDHFENPEGDDLWMDQEKEELPTRPGGGDEEGEETGAPPPAPPDPPDPPELRQETSEGNRVTEEENAETSIYETPPQTRATTIITSVENNTHTHT